MNGFQEEEAFWFMVSMIEDVVKPSYFKDMSTISIASQIVGNLLGEIFP